MATQDSSGGVNWGKVALSALGGAAAGYSADNVGEGFVRGLSFQQSQQDRQREIARQAKRDEQMNRLNAAKIRNAELSAQRQQQQLDQAQREKDIFDFNEELKLYTKLSEQDTLNFQKQYASRAISSRESDNKLIYPLTEDAAIEVDTHTRASETMANTRMYIAALERSLNPKNKAEAARASRMHKIIGQQLGYEFVPASEGVPAKVITPWGAFPATMESAPKIMEKAKEEAFAARKQYEDSRRTKQLAESGLLRAGYKISDDLKNIKKEAAVIANGYSQQIQSSDFLFRNHGIAHGIDFILNDKGGDMTKGEAVLMSNFMDKHNIRHDPNQQGEFKIHAGDFNKYVNKYLPEDQKKQVIKSNDWVEVDNDLVQTIYNNSGISDIKNNWRNEAQRINDSNRSLSEKVYIANLDRERRETILKEKTKQDISDAKLQAKVQRADSSISPQVILDNFQINGQRLGQELKDIVTSEARTQVDDSINEDFVKKFGGTQDEVLAVVDGEEMTSRQKRATNWLKRRHSDVNNLVDQRIREVVLSLRNPENLKSLQSRLKPQDTLFGVPIREVDTTVPESKRQDLNSITERLLGK